MHRPSPLHSRARRAGSAALLAAGLAFAPAADVTFYAVIKEKSHEQTNATPQLLAFEPFGFNALVVATNSGAVSGAFLQPPAGPATPLALETNTGSFFLLARYASEAALNAAYPNVSYTLGITGVNDGPKSLTMDLTSGMYPVAPRLANLVAAQSIIATNDFTLQWGAFVSGTANDLIQLVLTDGASNLVFTSPTFGQPGSLDGLSLSVPLPAGTLAPGRDYVGNLLFAKVFVSFQNQFAYPNVPGAAAFASRTTFPLQTAPALATRRPTLRVRPAQASAVTLEFDAEIGVRYRLEATTNLPPGAWATVFATNAASTNVAGIDPVGGADRGRFYRVVSP